MIKSPAGGLAEVTERFRTGLYVSLVVILVYWVAFATRQLLHPALPQSVAAIAIRVSITAALVLAICWFLLRRSGESLSDLGFTFAGFPRVLAWGLLAALGVFVIINVGLNSLLASVMKTGPTPVLRNLFSDPRDAGWWILAAIVGGGFSEELKRAFVLSRLDRLFGRPGLAAALVIDSAVFGLGHLYQGPAGAVSAGITGLICAFIFLRRRRVIDAMVVHALFDLLGIAAAYALYAGRH